MVEGQVRARIVSVLEVFLCSGFPTQIALAVVLGTTGFGVLEQAGQLSLAGVVALLLGNAAFVIGLIFYFLREHGERPWNIFVGTRAIGGELRIGLMLLPIVLVLAAGSVALLHRVWPDLRNVPQNPFETLLQSPTEVALFTIVAVGAGAIGEELQRAFILRRFEQHLGGGWVGLVVFSILFGLGHQMQGWDAAIVTGLLGLLWGVLYLTRRSVVPAVVSHAGFNIVQIAIAVNSDVTASIGSVLG